MDVSLDEMIKSKRTTTRKQTKAKAPAPRRTTSARKTSSVKQQAIGKAAATPKAKATKKATAAASSTTGQHVDKIIVSNLPVDVTEGQVKELFASTVGPLRSVQLHYDASGRSKGTAEVRFVKAGDGTKAFNHYNNRLIDGKRPMKIEIVMSTPVPQPSLVSRVAPAPEAKGTPAADKPKAVKKGRKVSRRKPGKRPAKTAEDLDAEMEDYSASNAPPPPAAA